MNLDMDFKYKWGDEILKSGWTGIPNLLLKHAKDLKISPTELVILIYLIRFWWRVNDLPFPSISKTSEEIGITRKTASKHFGLLKEKGFIKEVMKPNGQTAYSLEGLVEALEKYTQTE